MAEGSVLLLLALHEAQLLDKGTRRRAAWHSVLTDLTQSCSTPGWHEENKRKQQVLSGFSNLS